MLIHFKVFYHSYKQLPKLTFSRYLNSSFIRYLFGDYVERIHPFKFSILYEIEELIIPIMLYLIGWCVVTEKRARKPIVLSGETKIVPSIILRIGSYECCSTGASGETPYFWPCRNKWVNRVCVTPPLV